MLRYLGVVNSVGGGELDILIVDIKHAGRRLESCIGKNVPSPS